MGGLDPKIENLTNIDRKSTTPTPQSASGSAAERREAPPALRGANFDVGFVDFWSSLVQISVSGSNPRTGGTGRLKAQIGARKLLDLSQFYKARALGARSWPALVLHKLAAPFFRGETCRDALPTSLTRQSHAVIFVVCQ